MINFYIKKAILESGLKQIFIAREMQLDPTILSTKIHGYIVLKESEKKRLAEILALPLDGETK